MNRRFKRSPSSANRKIKGRPRIRRHVGYFAKLRLSLASHKRRLSIKGRAAQIANIRRLNQRSRKRKPRK